MPLSDSAKEHLRHVKLQMPQTKIIGYLAEHGGEVPWDWAKVTPPAKAMLADLMNKGLITDCEYVDAATARVTRVTLKLTDQGRQIATQIERMTVDANKPTTH